MHNTTIHGRIFIAGTGRSGTTRLAQLLGSHRMALMGYDAHTPDHDAPR